MNILELSKAGNISVNVTPQDLKQFASDIAKELATQPAPQIQPKYLTADEVCELLSISRVTLWHWDKKEITQPHKIGNLKRYRLSDIDELMTADIE